MNECEAFKVFKGEDDQWYWNVKAENGNIVATSGEGYTTKANALLGYAAAQSLIISMAGQRSLLQAREEAKRLEEAEESI